MVSIIGFGVTGQSSRDLLGQVYEYFLGQFASAEGKRGGQFYTPASIVKTLVAILAPHQGQVYDPCQVQAVCLFSPKDSSKPTAVRLAMSPYTDRNPTLSHMATGCNEPCHSRN